MIWRGNRDGIEVFVGESLANIGDTFGGKGETFLFDLLLEVFHTGGEDLLVGIDEVGDLDVFLPKVAADVTFPSAIEACYGDPKAIIGSDNLGSVDSSGNERGNTGGERGLEEMAAVF